MRGGVGSRKSKAVPEISTPRLPWCGTQACARTHAHLLRPCLSVTVDRRRHGRRACADRLPRPEGGACLTSPSPHTLSPPCVGSVADVPPPPVAQSERSMSKRHSARSSEKVGLEPSCQPTYHPDPLPPATNPPPPPPARKLLSGAAPPPNPRPPHPPNPPPRHHPPSPPLCKSLNCNGQNQTAKKILCMRPNVVAPRSPIARPKPAPYSETGLHKVFGPAASFGRWSAWASPKSKRPALARGHGPARHSGATGTRANNRSVSD